MLHFCHLFFPPNFHASYDFTTVTSHFPHFRGAETQLPHALFYLLLPSSNCIQVFVKPPAPKDSIYQDKHKINTLPTQTAHRRFSRSAADCGWCPAMITRLKHLKRSQPLVTSNLICVHISVLLNDPRTTFFFCTNNDNNNLEIINNNQL